MAAGDLLEGPGDVEWNGWLFSARTDSTGFWIDRNTKRNGWSPTWQADDLPTEAGASRGRAIPQAMYPDLLGACVNEASQVVALFASMDPEGDTEGPLCWWDYATDLRYRADASPRIREHSPDAADQMWSHRLVDLQWVIWRPGDIETLP